MRAFAIPVFASLLALAAQAQDSPGSFAVDRFRPALTSEGFLDVQSARVGDHLDFDLGLTFDYSSNPLIFLDLDGNRVASFVEHRVGAHVFGSLALFDWIRVGVDVPTTVFQSADESALPTLLRAPNGIGPVGLGDVRLNSLFRLLREEDALVDLALGVDVTVPTAIPQGRYGGDEALTFAPELALSTSFDRAQLSLGTTVAYHLRPTRAIGPLTTGQEIRYGAGFRWNMGMFGENLGLPFYIPVQVHGSFTGGVGVSSTTIGATAQSPAEAKLGLRIDLVPGWSLDTAYGVGVIPGIGAPDARLLFGLKYEKRVWDNDGDGVPNHDDKCPDAREDRDRFEDWDGCPDPDNDGDGILDVDDRCALEAEDMDGFVDEDGCPDLDNDQDGILDIDDKCPLEAEDKDGVDDEDGCPDADEAPDPDGDGVEPDACPDEAEDKDGFEDDDGCPDPDNDQDGVLDVDDKCPLEAETVNGVDDEDGCPDEKKVVLQERDIQILDKVFFELESARILAESFGLLREVAKILIDNPQVARVRVEGHTDGSGGEQFNLELSQRRAESVREFLIKAGVDAGRLEARGYGEQRPLAPNVTARGRDQNRRVEFVILD